MSFKKSLVDYVRLEEAKVAQGTGLMVGAVLAAVVLGQSGDIDAANHFDSTVDYHTHFDDWSVSTHLDSHPHTNLHSDVWC